MKFNFSSTLHAISKIKLCTRVSLKVPAEPLATIKYGVYILCKTFLIP